MEVLFLLMFIGAVWVLGAVAFFAWNLKVTNHDHVDRLALLPLEDNWQDARRPASTADDEGDRP